MTNGAEYREAVLQWFGIAVSIIVLTWFVAVHLL